MAALSHIDYNTGTAIFTISGERDISKLPTSHKWGSDELANNKPVPMGSKAVGIGGKNYILNEEDIWVEYNPSGSGSGGSSGDIEFADDDDVIKILYGI